MTAPFYETDSALSQYLLFHYGTPEETLSFPEGPAEALNFPVRCVSECLDVPSLPLNARALDLGCAVGRSSFELARTCSTVLGIDASASFIRAAQRLQSGETLRYRIPIEGDLFTETTATAPTDIPLQNVSFQTGDATNLPETLGPFNVVLMANLIDRLPDPRRCLARLPSLLRPNGQLILTSPYTWTEEYTPKSNWLSTPGKTAFDSLHEILSPHFELASRQNLPFLIREHARKYQWSVAEATTWRRRT